MKLLRSILATNLIFSLVFVSFLTVAIQSVSAQDSKVALQRGYRTGYSDGYMAGYRDAIDNATKSYARHSEYKNADRAFNETYGALTDYKDGYQQGFEFGYDTGFAKRDFDATIPTKLAKRGVIDVKEDKEKTIKTTDTKKVTTPIENNVAINEPTTDVTQPETNSSNNSQITPNPNVVTTTGPNNGGTTNTTIEYPRTNTIDNTTGTVANTSGTNTNQPPVITTKTEPVRSVASGNDIIIIPANTELIIELIDEIDTKRAREGDAFRAKITSPYEISGAIIEGRVAKNRRPGRLKRRAELILSFDRIKISETRWSNFNAIIMEVLPVKGDNVKRVDNEGEVEGQRPYKSDGTKIGAAAGSGLVIGAVVGGPVGAAVGAGVGAAFGVGAVVVERGKYIKLHQNQQLRIKTAYETQIR